MRKWVKGVLDITGSRATSAIYTRLLACDKGKNGAGVCEQYDE